MVRPYVQTDLSLLLAQGPRVAQSGSINSPSINLSLAHKKPNSYLFALFHRPAPSVLPIAAEWTASAGSSAGLLRLLVDAAPGGRVDAFKLFYDSSGTPTWLTAAGGLAIASDSATFNTSWCASGKWLCMPALLPACIMLLSLANTAAMSLSMRLGINYGFPAAVNLSLT